jgi:lysozyme family protein
MSDADFTRAVHFTLRYEGGYVHNPADPGGETNYGISKRAYPELDIAGLTRDDAIAIYHRDYWKAAGCDELAWPVSLAHFDCAVHSGISRATMLLQGLVGVSEDGQLGRETLEALASFSGGRGPVVVARQLVRERMRFLVRLERGKARWTFLAGFMDRVFDLACRIHDSP